VTIVNAVSPVVASTSWEFSISGVVNFKSIVPTLNECAFRCYVRRWWKNGSEGSAGKEDRGLYRLS
jgi:hypothetical protein